MTWNDFIREESQKDYYKSLSEFIREDAETHTIYPAHSDIFNAFKYTPFDKVKVVILGQDPYHGANQAHGLAFSVQPECAKPPSLNNIFNEVRTDLGTDHKFTDGCLIPWAKQGVLLLNTALTVRAGEANSHQNIGWEKFTERAISLLNDSTNPIVFILWGSNARSKKRLISNPKHLILESAHPSPLSVYKGFYGSKPFSTANKFLTENGIEPINWLF